MVIPPNRLPRISRTIGADVPLTPALQQRVAGDLTGKTRIPSPFKWAGSKASPHYLGPLRDSAQMTGAKRLLEPTLGGANIALNMPMREVAANDADAYLVNAYKQMRDAPGGLELDWTPWKGHGMTEGNWKKDELPDPDRISKPTFLGPRASKNKKTGIPKYVDYDGPVMRGITSGEDPGSFNAMIAQFQADPRSVNPQDMAEMFMMNQQLSMNAWSRLNQKGQYNQSPGSLRIGEDKWNYKEYQPLMEHWTMSQSPMDDWLDTIVADPLADQLVVDPPYGGGEVGGYDYLDLMGGDSHKDLAQQLGGLAEDGLPIVAFNAATEADHYRDAGFRTLLNRRPDATSSKAETRGIKPEMIAIANIPQMTADRWFQHHPTQRFGTQQGDIETWNKDPRFDEDFDPDLWKAQYFPNGDPQLNARRSIVNDLDALSYALRKALAPAPKPVAFTEHDLFLFSHMMWDDDISKEEEDLLSRTPSPSAPMTDAEREARMKTMDYPITGMEITPFGRGELDENKKIQRRLIQEMAGSKPGSAKSYPVSWTSKMPGPSFNTPTDFCQAGTGMRDKDGTVCRDCNVHYNKRRYDRMMSDPQNWARSMASIIPQYARMMYEDGQMMPLDADYGDVDGRHGYMRWHDSGDLQGPQHLALLADVARATPSVNHWIPTKELAHVADYIKAGGVLPENMMVRLSMQNIGQGASLPKTLQGNPQISTSTVGRSQIDPNYDGYICPASMEGSEGCVGEECNACWRGDFDNIDYQLETEGKKGKLPVYDQLTSGMQREYEHLNPAIPQDIFGDEDAFNQFVQSDVGSAMMDRVLRRV